MAKRKSTIKNLEVPYNSSINCPFCGQKVLPSFKECEDGEDSINPCSHTLFTANDEGFEYISEEFGTMFNINILSSPDEGYDRFTSNLKLPEAIKIARYAPPPSFFGEYAGFAPKQDLEGFN